MSFTCNYTVIADTAYPMTIRGLFLAQGRSRLLCLGQVLLQGHCVPTSRGTKNVCRDFLSVTYSLPTKYCDHRLLFLCSAGAIFKGNCHHRLSMMACQALMLVLIDQQGKSHRESQPPSQSYFIASPSICTGERNCKAHSWPTGKGLLLSSTVIVDNFASCQQ